MNEIVGNMIIPALPNNDTVAMFVNFTYMMDMIIDYRIPETDILGSRAISVY
jgi:hypothetical protein